MLKTGTEELIISVQAVEALCVHFPDEKTESIVEKKVNEIIMLKKSGSETFHLETQIDLMAYKLYELTYDEAQIVEPGLGGIISREDYEKSSIEELAEWEV